MLTWKIVRISEVLVIYIYIYRLIGKKRKKEKKKEPVSLEKKKKNCLSGKLGSSSFFFSFFLF